MSTVRPYVLSIAGFDPSSGAGISADIKTFEQRQVYGFSICTALTTQSDNKLLSVDWIPVSKIIGSFMPLAKKFNIKACKIGIIENTDTLKEVIKTLKKAFPAIKIVFDPIIKSSSGFSINQTWTLNHLKGILKDISLLTPNYDEIKLITGESNGQKGAEILSVKCPVLLKGGHHAEHIGLDTLYTSEEITHYESTIKQKDAQKHGSGCVLSAAITSELGKGKSLVKACELGKRYTEQFLTSNTSLLGYHT